MNKLISLPLIVLMLASTADAQNTVAPAVSQDRFNCPVPVGKDGYINIYQMITALSKCAGVNTDFFTNDELRTEILGFGLYQPIRQTTDSGEPDPNGTLVGLGLSTWGTKFQLSQGLIFGMRVVFDGTMQDQDDTIEIHILHPSSNPDAIPQQIDDVSYKVIHDNQSELLLFQIGSPEEMTPGIWTFEIRRRGRIIAVKRFDMTL